MVALTIKLRDAIAEQIDKEAKQRDMTVEQIVEENLTQRFSQVDPKFRRRLDAILAEDHELLRRLA